MPVTPASAVLDLEAQVRYQSLEVGIKPRIWRRFTDILGELKAHNDFMYCHSLRVGLYTLGLARLEGQVDLKFPLLAGCGHDIGKCEVANLLLDSKDLQPAEFEEIKQHAVQGYARLKDDFLFTSLVAGLHHKYRADGYGIDLEEAVPAALSVATKASVAAMA